MIWCQGGALNSRPRTYECFHRPVILWDHIAGIPRDPGRNFPDLGRCSLHVQSSSHPQLSPQPRWTRAECHQLWEDIVQIGVAEGDRRHFIGSVVYVAAGQGTVSTPPPLVVIDGQQRLTTLALLLVALARVLGEETEVSGFSARRIRAYYLMNELESGDERFKLLLPRRTATRSRQS